MNLEGAPARAVVIPADVRFPLERANGVQIVKTAAALARAGVATTLLVRKSDPRPTPDILAWYGVDPHPRLTVRRLQVFHRPGSFFVPRATFLARAGAATAAALLRGDVVYTRDLQLADGLLRLRLGGPRRLVYEAHAVEALMYRERAALYGSGEQAHPRKAARIARREARLWKAAAGVVTTTAGIRNTLEERYGTLGSPRLWTRVIANGCDVPAGRVFEPPRNEPRILYAGQLYPWKGVDVLVRAVARVPEARLVILGGIPGEADAARVRGLIETLGLAARVEMAGLVSQARVAEELARARVVAVPFLRTVMTERHTSPLKTFEAMAAGRAIVASDLPSSREVLRDGENALLVPPGDPQALAAAVRRLLGDSELAERLARAAFDEAPRYAWKTRAAHLRQLFEELP